MQSCQLKGGYRREIFPVLKTWAREFIVKRLFCLRVECAASFVNYGHSFVWKTRLFHLTVPISSRQAVKQR